jgi:hypothetical protein
MDFLLDFFNVTKKKKDLSLGWGEGEVTKI